MLNSLPSSLPEWRAPLKRFLKRHFPNLFRVVQTAVAEPKEVLDPRDLSSLRIKYELSLPQSLQDAFSDEPLESDVTLRVLDAYKAAGILA